MESEIGEGKRDSLVDRGWGDGDEMTPTGSGSLDRDWGDGDEVAPAGSGSLGSRDPPDIDREAASVLVPMETSAAPSVEFPNRPKADANAL